MRFDAEFGWRCVGLSEEQQDTRFVNLSIGPIDKPVLHSPSALLLNKPFCIFFTKNLSSHNIEKIAPLAAFHPVFRQPVNVAICEAFDKCHLGVVAYSPMTDEFEYFNLECAAAVAIAAFRRRIAAAIAKIDFGKVSYRTACYENSCRAFEV